MPKVYHKWIEMTGKDDKQLERVVNEIDKVGLVICGLQGVRRLNKGSAVIKTDTRNQYEIYWSNNKLKRQHGVGIVIKTDPNIDIHEISPVNSRLIVADVNVYGCHLRIINCYAPTNIESAKNTFYCQLKKTI